RRKAAQKWKPEIVRRKLFQGYKQALLFLFREDVADWEHKIWQNAATGKRVAYVANLDGLIGRVYFNSFMLRIYQPDKHSVLRIKREFAPNLWLPIGWRNHLYC